MGGMIMSLIGFIFEMIDQFVHVDYPQITMGVIDGRIVLNSPYSFTLVNIGNTLWIYKVVDKDDVFNPYAYDFKQTPVEWENNASKYFTLKEDLSEVPDNLNLTLLVQDIKHRYFRITIWKDQGIIKTESIRTLKCLAKNIR